MLDKVPVPIADLLAPMWVFVISLIGAAVGWLEDIKSEDTWQLKLLKAASHVSSSALAAVLTYHTLLAMEIDQRWHVPLVGIAGHMGVAALRWMGEFYKGRMVK